MSRRKSYNPERRDWRGRSHKRGGERVAELRERDSCGCANCVITEGARARGIEIQPLSDADFDDQGET